MLYAIGNKPIFPDSFDYKNYYYYLKFEQNGKDYEIIRKGDSFIVQTDNVLHMLDGISELKRYWTKEIFELPEFQFRGKQHLSDLELFIQLFFVGQDAKNTSNIFNPGYYHKDDFKNMLLSYSGVSVENISSDDEYRIKRELESLRAARKDKLDLSDFYKSHSAATEYISHIKDIGDIMNIFFNSRIYTNQSFVNALFGKQQKTTRSQDAGCSGTRDTLTISASGKEKLVKNTKGRIHNTNVDKSIDLKSYIASAQKTNQKIIDNAGTQINAKTSEYMSTGKAFRGDSYEDL